MKRQRGVTLTGLIIACIVLVLAAILAFKVVPVYMEYRTIQNLFKAMAEDPALQKGTKRDFERAWAARTTIDNVKSVTPDNIDFTKDSSGVVISADYSVKVPLMRNVSLMFDFHPSSSSQ